MTTAKSILTVDTDITEKKQFEAQFRAQRLESIGTLPAASPDLNNVLAPIMMSAQLLQMKISQSRSAAAEDSGKQCQTWSSISQASSIVCARSRRKAHDSSSQALNFGNSAHCQRDISQID